MIGSYTLLLLVFMISNTVVLGSGAQENNQKIELPWIGDFLDNNNLSTDRFYQEHIFPLINIALKQGSLDLVATNLTTKFNEDPQVFFKYKKYFQENNSPQPWFEIIQQLLNSYSLDEVTLANCTSQERINNKKDLAISSLCSLSNQLFSAKTEQDYRHDCADIPMFNSNVIRDQETEELQNTDVSKVFKRLLYSGEYKTVHKPNVVAHEQKCKLRLDVAPKVFKYSCQYGCGYGSEQKGHATTHEKTCPNRPDDAPEVFKYPCQYNCGCVSVHKSNVSRHEKTCRLRPAGAPEVFKYPCQYGCGYKSVQKGGVTRHEKTCKLRPGGPQVIGSKRKRNDGQG